MDSIRCIIETPKGSGAKYDFDPKQNGYELTKILPAGLVFPFDFGYIPGTKGEDGDPLDVMVVSDVPILQGCSVKCRIIGAIQAVQQERNGDRMRNDRYIAVPDVSAIYGHVRKISRLPERIVQETEQFFINYNQQAGKKFKPLRWLQSAEALKMLKSAQSHPERTILVQLLLPLSDKDGHPFPEKYYTSVRRKLTQKFGGITMYSRSPGSGLWKDVGNNKVGDGMVVYEVMISNIDSSFWNGYKEVLQKQFQQTDLIIRRLEAGLL